MNIIIAGGGPAAAAAAVKCRKLDKNCSITLFSDEAVLPYRRPRLVALLKEPDIPEGFIIHPESFYQQNDITVKLQSSIIGIDIAEKRISLLDNHSVKFDRLLLATGASSKKLPVKKFSEQLFYLNNYQDVLKIKSSLPTARTVAVIGGGVLGLEIASALLSMEHEVILIERNRDLLHGVLDSECSEFLRNRLFRLPNLRIITNCQISSISRRNDQLCCLLNNTVIRHITVDMAICAIGTQANHFPGSSDVIAVDEFLRSNISNDIFAAGNCALVNGRKNEYLSSALRQAEIAAENMLVPNENIMKKFIFPLPEFRCQLNDTKIYTAGCCNAPDLESAVENDGISLKKLYYKGDKLVGCALIGENIVSGDLYNIICRNYS